MLTRVLRTVRLDTIDRRSQAGVFMRRLREDLVAQLGGKVSAAQSLLIDEIAKKALITSAVGDYILREGAEDKLVRKGKGALLPIVNQHDQLQATLVRMLTTLGLERKAKPVETLESYLARKAEEEDADAAEGEAGNQPG